MKGDRKLGPVIVINGECRTCQLCLIKWARKYLGKLVYCNTCYRKQAGGTA